MTNTASLWMLAGSVAFATMGASAHALGGRCDWLVVGLVRSIVMFSVMVLWARAARVSLVVWKPVTLWQRSLAGSISLICNFYALAMLPVSDALAITNTFPLWIVILTALQLRRWPALAELMGVVCGLLGVVLIERPDLGGGRFAVGVALASSFSTALALLGLHRLRTIDTRAVVAHFAGVSSIVALLWLLARPSALHAGLLDPTTILLLASVAISGTAGQFCLTRAYSAGSPARMAVVGLTQVVFAMGFDMFFWDRSLSPSMLVGFVLVVGPSAWLNARTRNPPTNEPRPVETSRRASSRVRPDRAEPTVSGRP